MPSRLDTQAADGAGDGLLEKVTQPQFDAVEFLNDVLPTLNLSSQPQNQKADRTKQIQSVSAETSTLFNSLNALNIRSSADLTSLTDEIVRSGNRLAYEVEVLRGDVNGLHEVLTETLRDDIALFVRQEVVEAGDEVGPEQTNKDDGSASTGVPDFITQLRMLGSVKARLESVVTVFGEAMKWPIPPSELSMASNLISVSSPEFGIQSTAEDEKAQEIARAIRAEVSELLNSGDGAYGGLEAAAQRVDEYRQLATLWKGTGEEKARIKFVDTLTKIVEDRRKALDAKGASRKADGGRRSNSVTGRSSKAPGESGGAAGLFRNLQRLKDDLYLE